MTATHDFPEETVLAGKKLVEVFVCGAQKSGTTFFYNLFSQNDSINPSLKKEPHFFHVFYDRGLEWYDSLFDWSSDGLVCDVSPDYYLGGETTAIRIQQYNPQAKLIFVLRDPLSRAVSHYWHNVRKGNEPLSFKRAIECENFRANGSFKEFRRYSYLLKSKYYELLRPFYDHFDNNQLLVVIFEQYLKCPTEENARIESFLDLPAASCFDNNFVNTPVKQGGRPLFISVNHWLYSYKSLFRMIGATKLRKWLIRINLAWGKPYPRIDQETYQLASNLLEEDTSRLIEFLGLGENPWKL